MYLGRYVTLFDCISFFLSCVGIPIYVCWSVNVSLPLAYGRMDVGTLQPNNVFLSIYLSCLQTYVDTKKNDSILGLEMHSTI